MSGNVASERPFSDDEIADLFAGLRRFETVAAAVSGGGDSVAMLLLLRRWSELESRRRGRLVALTVDHGLRVASSAEARSAARLCRRLGVPHGILRPASPIRPTQSAAREARYALMLERCRRRAWDALALAHTLDDQAETFLMRLARGGGVDALAAMTPSATREGVILSRPLLEVSRRRLRAHAEREGAEIGAEIVDDPTNFDPRYERTRIRAAREARDVLGMSDRALALSARRMASARDALDAAAQDALRGCLESPLERGFRRLSSSALFALPDETAHRVLASCLRSCGDLGSRRRPLPPSALERILRRLRDVEVDVTLGGCRLGRRGDSVYVAREAGRMRESERERVLSAGGEILWDRRLVVSAPARVEGIRFRVAPLGDSAAAALAPKGFPRFVASSVAAIRRRGRLLAAPDLGYFDSERPWTAEFSSRSSLV